MASRNIILNIGSQDVQTDEYLDNLCVPKKEIYSDREKLNKKKHQVLTLAGAK